MDKLELAAIVTHVADARTCVLHPASHTHRQMNDEQLKEAGVNPDLIRFSVGLGKRGRHHRGSGTGAFAHLKKEQGERVQMRFRRGIVSYILWALYGLAVLRCAYPADQDDRPVFSCGKRPCGIFLRRQAASCFYLRLFFSLQG